MSHPVRTTLAGLAVATTLVGLSACGSSSSASTSSSTSTSTSVSSASPSATSGDTSATAPAASDSASASTAASTAASASVSPDASASRSASGALNPQALFNDARRTALAATSAHVQGYVLDNNTRSQLNFEGRTDGTNLAETFQEGSSKRLEMITVGGKYWLRGDRASMAHLAGAKDAARLGSKWLLVPSATARQLMGASSLRSLLQGMFSQGLSNEDSKNTRITTTTLDGKPAYRLSDTKGENAMWVSTDADHHMMRMAGTTFGRVDFTEWNSAPLQKAPAASEVYHA